MHDMLYARSNEFLIGNIYIADSTNCRIRKVTISTGIITTIAGDGRIGNDDDDGDGGDATSAVVYHPQGVVVDATGIASYFILTSILKCSL